MALFILASMATIAASPSTMYLTDHESTAASDLWCDARSVGGVLVDGAVADTEVVRVEVPSASVPAEQRTAAQVAAVQRAGEQLLNTFLEAAPAGAAPLVTLTRTATGAVFSGVLVDPRQVERPVPVPVEDVVVIKGGDTRVLVAAIGRNGLPQPVRTRW